MILVCANGPDFHVVSLELRHLQCIDAIIFRVGADELHEGDLPTEIEGGHQAIVSSCDLKPHTLPVQHLGLRSRSASVKVRKALAARLGSQVNAEPSNMSFHCVCGNAMSSTTIAEPKNARHPSLVGCRCNQEEAFSFARCFLLTWIPCRGAGGDDID